MKRTQDNWDFPDWEDIKLYGQGILAYASPATGPVATLPILATLSTKKAIESTGKKMTSKEVSDLLTYNQKETAEVLHESIDKNLVGPVVGFFGNIKTILFVVLIIVILLQFRR